ncbi:gamma carbonic anhydrase family protein [uncultured Faecalibaculum sp.]|uniref:gamma carbonic anhydrase family protein n=1 Tax=uncultured Faecalibaculum sp. TaxID=1729681 RepID=UPI00261DFE83|nr:gamma carbonic anhydrase family protein [uncultured Faecalibaculum sp.]
MHISEEAWIAPGAVVAGDVTMEAGSSVWFHCTVRAEEEPVVIGKDSNVQDNSVIHTDPGYPVILGDSVTVGHGCILHGCRIGDETLIGMGAIVLNGAAIGSHCLIGAGALVTQNAIIPDGSLVLGSPARVIKPVTEQQIQEIRENAMEYVMLSGQYRLDAHALWSPGKE